MKLTEKTKKYLAIGGGAVICIGLIAAISLQFGKAPAGEDTLPQKSPTSSEIVVDPSSLATRTDESGAYLLPMLFTLSAPLKRNSLSFFISYYNTVSLY